jgi:phage-related tail fiber protein
MSNYNTGNPVPSTDPRDLDDNATVFDNLANGTNASYPDRLGVARKSWYQMEQDAAALVSPNVASLASLTLSANKGLYATGAATLATYDLTSLGRTLGGIADADAARAALAAAASGVNTDITSITGSAASLTTSRSISTTGDATWTVNFNGTANVTAAITLANSGVGAGTYQGVTVDAKGRVTAGVALGGFTNLPLSNSWVAGARAAYRKVFDMVQIEVVVTGGVVTDNTVVGTLPSGFRPTQTITIPVVAGPAATPAIGSLPPRVLVGTDGTIKCLNIGSGQAIQFNTFISTV